MNQARYRHAASLLTNGKVLVAGGLGEDDRALNSAELYDPLAEIWTVTGSMNNARFDHTSSILPNGKVLVIGGANGIYLNSAELYDPSTGIWTTTGSMHEARSEHTASLLYRMEKCL
jgi:hypothetical protein